MPNYTDDDEQYTDEDLKNYLANDRGEAEDDAQTQLPVDASDDETPAQDESKQDLPVIGMQQASLTKPVPFDAEKHKEDLIKQYAAANDMSGVKDAQDKAAHTNFVANLGAALEGLAKSNSMAHGGAGVNTSFYTGLKQQGQQGIENAQQQRQAAIQQFSQNNQINHQVMQDMLLNGNVQQQQAGFKMQADMNDPNSQQSKNAQAFAKTAFGSMPEFANLDISKMSANDITSASKELQKKSAIDSQADYRKQIAQERQDKVGKQNANKDLADLKKDLDTQAMTTRTNLGAAQSKLNGAQKLMTFAHVTPDQIDAAANDPKSKAALEQKLNHLTPQQYTEIVSGLMSQVQNGQGSFGQLEHMRANTSDQTLANIQQFFTNNPAPANVGGLIVNNLMTLKNEADTSQSYIDQHNAKMMKAHPHAFAHPDTAMDAQNMLEAFTQPQQQNKNNGLSSDPAAAKTVSNPAPKGEKSIVQKGITYTWDGNNYVPQPQMASAGR